MHKFEQKFILAFIIPIIALLIVNYLSYSMIAQEMDESIIEQKQTISLLENLQTKLGESIGLGSETEIRMKNWLNYNKSYPDKIANRKEILLKTLIIILLITVISLISIGVILGSKIRRDFERKRISGLNDIRKERAIIVNVFSEMLLKYSKKHGLNTKELVKEIIPLVEKEIYEEQ